MTALSLEELVGRQAITDVLHRYCYAMDSFDADLAREIWHPDGEAHYVGIFDGLGNDYMEWVSKAQRSSFEVTSHHLANIVIEIDGDRAKSESCVTATQRLKNSDQLLVVLGRYHDMWSRRNGEWRIDRRVFTTDLMDVRPQNEELPPALTDPSSPKSG